MTEEAEARATRLRLSLLNAIYSTLRRNQEVLATITASSDRSEANAAIRSLLDVDRTQADAVLDLGWNRLTAASIQQVADEIARISALSNMGQPAGP